MESNINKLKHYQEVIDFNNFTDFLIAADILGKKDYYGVWVKPERHRLNELFNHIVSQGTSTVNVVLNFLAEAYQNIEGIKEDERNFRNSSVRGSFPKLPSNYVKRDNLTKHLRQKLEHLSWEKKVVVYGMVGYGKSCLVNEVLNDRTLRKYFDNHLFWVNLGEHHSTDNVLQTMWRLYLSASDKDCFKKIHCPDDVIILKEQLQELFLEDRLKNALLILDDVCSAEVLKLFDIGCKIVVTTQDKNILGKEHADFLEVKTGFSLNEAMDLFKIALDMEADLPFAAEQVYYICKGHPMLISLIGSYLSENKSPLHAVRDEIWEYVKNMFLRGDYRLNEYDQDAHIPNEMIGNCVNKLLSISTKLKSRFEDLAVFIQDVNIPPQVLEILWDTDDHDVRNTMNKLAEKSLVVPFYHNDLQRFIYGIHDIHLNYLKEETSHKIVDLHRKLISGYDKLTNENYALLPDDNYSLHFIGYHLYNAQLFDRFKIYFDLRFIEAKVKSAGKEDLLRDFEKYKDLITRGDIVLTLRLTEYKEFVARHGTNLFNFKKTDIVQYTLQEPKQSYVYQEGLRYAKESSNLYFHFQRSVDGSNDSEEITVKDDITCACFVDSKQNILVGTSSGNIKLFFENYDKEISCFSGHTGPIKSLKVSPDRSHFLSVGEDGYVMFWKFTADSKRNSYDNAFLVSPKATQKGWHDFHIPDAQNISPKKKFPASKDRDQLVCANFATNFPESNLIVTGSYKGNIAIWNIDNQQILASTGGRGFEATCVYLTPETVYFSCDDVILSYEIVKTDDRMSLRYFKSWHSSEKILSFFLRGEELLGACENSVVLWFRSSKQYSAKMDEGSNNLCAAITDDGKYLLVSNDNSLVYFWDVQKKEMIRVFVNKGFPRSLDTLYDDNNSVHMLLIGSDKRTLHLCHIQPCDGEPNMNSSPIFCPHWKNKHPFIPRVEENKIQILRGYVPVSETEAIAEKVTRTCFSVCGNKVIYGLSNGELRSFSIKSKANDSLKNIENRGAINYLKCFDPDNSFVSSKRTESTCSGGCSLVDFNSNNDYFNGVTVAMSEEGYITLETDSELHVKKIKKPFIFFKGNNPYLVAQNCQIYRWNLDTKTLIPFQNTFNAESFDLDITTVDFCHQKDLLALCFQQDTAGVLSNFLDIVYVNEDRLRADVKMRLNLDCKTMCSSFSPDGNLLAVGMESGVIKVWCTNDFKQPTSLEVHKEPVEKLLFSPSVEPILISLSDEVCWWNLKKLKKVPKLVRGRPRSIDILDTLSDEVCNMNIGYWCDKSFIKDVPYLLSCLRLQSKVKYVSASSDFNTFLLVDAEGKIYIIDILNTEDN